MMTGSGAAGRKAEADAALPLPGLLLRCVFFL